MVRYIEVPRFECGVVYLAEFYWIVVVVKTMYVFALIVFVLFPIKFVGDNEQPTSLFVVVEVDVVFVRVWKRFCIYYHTLTLH